MTSTNNGRALCVYCGAQNRVAPHFLEAGKRFGQLMAEKDITLVYGGGDCGMMGAVANSVLQSGGKVVGVFPVELQGMEAEHRGLTEIHIDPLTGQNAGFPRDAATVD